MTKQELYDKVQGLMQKDLALMMKKNADYSAEDDALSNFRDFGFKGIIVRIGDKWNRIKNIVRTGKIAVKDESLTDTMRDAIIYLYLARVMKDED